MARSLLTLAASVTSAVPGASVSGVGSLTSGGAGRCDSAVVSLADGTSVIVRAPVDATAARELAAEALALRALTPGVRELLGFRAPRLLGEAGLGDARALVCDMLPGFHIDAAHIPPGEGAATSIGYALASLHALPHSVVRAEGLPQRTPEEARDDVRTVIDRAGATGRLPVRLTVRWRDAVEADALWRFESTVTLGGAAASSFLYQDTDMGPAVTGVLDWHGLSVGDPAVDLRWLASAPEASDDIYAAYSAAAHRSPDAFVQTRARLYAELEFAQWLVHGSDAHRPDVVDDATALLDALADGVGADSLLDPGAATSGGVDDAIALLASVPEPAAASDVDTSMQTDAYDPEMISLFSASEREHSAGARSGVTGRPAPDEDVSTAPIDISAWIDAKTHSSDADGNGDDEEVEAERAARAAIHRWASSGSE
ncbi:phosphotransferase [Micromonospora sp. DT81.3]|uniref:phosphotransferase n=1 Tax=Micromonospora sp. DT81.3 TaxID=3416523 RepID=UPI003CF1C818